MPPLLSITGGNTYTGHHYSKNDKLFIYCTSAEGDDPTRKQRHAAPIPPPLCGSVKGPSLVAFQTDGDPVWSTPTAQLCYKFPRQPIILICSIFPHTKSRVRVKRCQGVLLGLIFTLHLFMRYSGTVVMVTVFS